MHESRTTMLPESVPLPDGHPTARWWMRSTGVGAFFGRPLRFLWRAWHRLRTLRPRIKIRNNVYPISKRHSFNVSVSWETKDGPRA